MRTNFLKYFFPVFLCGIMFNYFTACKPVSKANIASLKLDSCVQDMIDNLNIDMNMKTNPELLRTILKNDMYMEDFPEASKRLGSKLQEPQNLYPMLSSIALALSEKQPAIREVICAANSKKLLPRNLDENAKSILTKAIHHTYLLEELTKLMGHSVEFTRSIHANIMQKRADFGIHEDFIRSILDMYKITNSVFVPAKTLAMDSVIEEFNSFRDKYNGPLPKEIVYTQQKQLILNVTEAIIGDTYMGNKTNAMAGVALAINPFTEESVIGNNDNSDDRFVTTNTTKEWANLYETWNFAFMTPSVSNLYNFYPKLLIPSVIDTPPENYLFNRSLSLWLTMNFHIFNKKVNKPFTELPNAKEIGKIWGNINMKYGKRYTKETHNRELCGVSDLVKIPLTELVEKYKVKLIELLNSCFQIPSNY